MTDKAGSPRVTIVVNSPVLGGGELGALRAAEELMEHIHVEIAGPPHGALHSEAVGRGLDFAEVSLAPKLSRATALPNVWKAPRDLVAFRRFVRSRTVDGWVVLQYKWEELLWGGAPNPNRVVLWEHGPIPAELQRFRPTRRRLARAFTSAAAVFAWSEPAQESIRRLCGREAVMFPAGVDDAGADHARLGRSAVRGRLGIGESDPVAVYAGRVHDDKGILEVVRAMSCIEKAHLVICGEGPAEAEVKRLAVELGVTSRVHMVGHVQDTLSYLAAADVTVLLTRQPGEGRPLVGLESFTVGTPVIGLSSSPAMRGLAREGSVTLIPDAAPDTISDAIRTIAGAERPHPMSYSWDTAVARMLEVLGVRA